VDPEEEAAVAVIRARVAERVAALEAVMTDALPAAFALLARLCEVESMVRVLQLVSVLVEVLGVRVAPHLPAIAAALPQAWAFASQHMPAAGSSGASPAKAAASKKDGGSGDTGAVVRLHSALLAVATHLVGKLRRAALSDPQVAATVYPLLHYATSLGSPESECLVEEAFRLWSCALSALPEVPPPLLGLLPHLAAILARGRDNTAALGILESYLLLGAAPSVIPLMDLIQGALVNTVKAAETATIQSLTPATGPGAPGQGGMPAGGMASAAAAAAQRVLSPETAAEAMAASALADVMLQLSPHEVPSLLAPTFRAMAAFVAHPALPAQGLNIKVVNVLEGFLEVLGRVFMVSPAAFAALIPAHDDQHQQQQQHHQGQGGQQGGAAAGPQSRFIDKWLTVASARFLEEVIGVKTMAMLGRYRRRIATASLCALVAAGATPPALLDTPAHTARACTLAVQAVCDDPDFHTDQADLDALDFKADLGEDSVLARRLQVTRADPVRSLNVVDAVTKLLGGLAQALGSAEALLSVCSTFGSARLAARVQAVLSGQLGTLVKLEEVAEEEDEEDLLATSE